jgi:hypothetical protein
MNIVRVVPQDLAASTPVVDAADCDGHFLYERPSGIRRYVSFEAMGRLAPLVPGLDAVMGLPLAK